MRQEMLWSPMLILSKEDDSMNIGMLWFDNDPKADLTIKISRAAVYYRSKYGQTPTICFVHPSMIASNPVKAGGIEVRTSRSVLPNHFWIGINGNSAQAKL
jgi:hypothetical protein